MAKFWRVEADWKELSWDRYEGFVVCADSADEAILIIKERLIEIKHWAEENMNFFNLAYATVTVLELTQDFPKGIVLVDFSAG